MKPNAEMAESSTGMGKPIKPSTVMTGPTLVAADAKSAHLIQGERRGEGIGGEGEGERIGGREGRRGGGRGNGRGKEKVIDLFIHQASTQCQCCRRSVPRRGGETLTTRW